MLATATQANSQTNSDPEFRFGSTGRAPRVCGLNRGSGLRTRTTLLGYDIRRVFLFLFIMYVVENGINSPIYPPYRTHTYSVVHSIYRVSNKLKVSKRQNKEKKKKAT